MRASAMRAGLYYIVPDDVDKQRRQKSWPASVLVSDHRSYCRAVPRPHVERGALCCRRCGWLCFLAAERRDDLVSRIDQGLTLCWWNNPCADKGVHLVDKRLQLIDRRLGVAMLQLLDRRLEFGDQPVAL